MHGPIVYVCAPIMMRRGQTDQMPSPLLYTMSSTAPVDFDSERGDPYHFRIFDVERTFPRVSCRQQNILNINEYIWEVDI